MPPRNLENGKFMAVAKTASGGCRYSEVQEIKPIPDIVLVPESVVEKQENFVKIIKRSVQKWVKLIRRVLRDLRK